MPGLTLSGLETPPPGVATTASQRRDNCWQPLLPQKLARPLSSTTAVLPPAPTKISSAVPRIPTVPAGVLIL